MVATSAVLREKWHARAVRLIPNGVADSFLTALDGAPVVPPELAAIPRPRLLYVGVLDRWLDQESLVLLARRTPEWSLVFVGPVGGPVAALPNVHLLGTRLHAALPGYLASAVGLIPFAV